MNAPIDLVIDLLKRRLQEAKREKNSYPPESNPYSEYAGEERAYESLIEEFEGFKKLFS